MSRRRPGPALRTLLPALVALGACAAQARPLPAQAAVRGAAPRRPAPRVEGRAEAILARSSSFQLGAAALWPASPYLQLGAAAAAGMTRGPDAADRDAAASSRAEGLARFTLEPDPGARWRLYGQATAGVLWVRGQAGRALVGVALGVEHAPVGAFRPALELGMGGGLRLALALRPAR